MRRIVVTILAGLAIICVAAVVDVTLLGGDGKGRRSEDGDRCLEPLDPVTVEIDLSP